MKHRKFYHLLARGEHDFKRVHKFFNENISDDELLTHILKEGETKELTFGQRLADRVASFGGSWTFIILFACVLAVWIGLNTVVLSTHPYDPYPFILLNLILSCVAALQAPVIMMSQNRQEAKDRQRAEHDYLINLRAETEIRNLQINMKKLFEIQEEQIEHLEELRRKR